MIFKAAFHQVGTAKVEVTRIGRAAGGSAAVEAEADGSHAALPLKTDEVLGIRDAHVFSASASSTALKTDDEAPTSSDCAGALVLAGKTSSGEIVCEDLSLNGSFVFHTEQGSLVDFGKRVYSQHPAGTPWASSGDHDAVDHLLAQDPSGWLLTGANLTANSTQDPSYDDVFAQAPPIRASQFSSLRFTGSREARMDVIFNHRGGTLPWNGQPSPENVLHESIDYNHTFEGLVGGELPIIHVS